MVRQFRTSPDSSQPWMGTRDPIVCSGTGDGLAAVLATATVCPLCAEESSASMISSTW
jgi:hypothetical protein